MNWSARPKATLVFAATVQVWFSEHIVVQPLGRLAADAVWVAAITPSAINACGNFIVHSLLLNPLHEAFESLVGEIVVTCMSAPAQADRGATGVMSSSATMRWGSHNPRVNTQAAARLATYHHEFCKKERPACAGLSRSSTGCPATQDTSTAGRYVTPQ